MPSAFLQRQVQILKEEFPGHDCWIDGQVARYLAEPGPPDDVEFVAFTRNGLESARRR